MLNVVLAMQIVAIFLLAIVLLYMIQQRPSRMQILLVIMLVSTIVMLTGYLVEIKAENIEEAMSGVAMAYIGKPFALLTSFLFIADYCGLRVPRAVSFGLSIYGGIFPVLIYSNNYHHLYYSSASFDIGKSFSPLSLGRGPLYYGYMLLVFAVFLSAVFLTIREIIRSKAKVPRIQAFMLFGSVFASVAGYLIYLTGFTGGYDTTMLGAVIGTFLFTILFFKYKLFDSVSLAKEQALDSSDNGLIVIGRSGRLEYGNRITKRLISDGLKMDDLISMEDGSKDIKLNNKVYEIIKKTVDHNDRYLGKTVEIIDVTERHNYSTKLEEEVVERTRELQHVQRSAIVSFAGIVEARDNNTGQHVKRLSRIVELICISLRKRGYYADILTDDFISCFRDVVPLHDIGKLSIPDSILLKPGKLTPEEFEVIKTHTTHGARIVVECLTDVEDAKYVNLARNVALYHHEKWNGTGYPEKLSGNDIPLSPRITAVADVYDAIRSERCYKPAMNAEEAKQVILDGRGTHFDPEIVDAFIDILPEIEKDY